MRIVIVSALLLAAASCAWPPPPEQAAPPPASAATVPAPVPLAPMIAAAPPAAPPAVATAPATRSWPGPLGWLFGPPPAAAAVPPAALATTSPPVQVAAPAAAPVLFGPPRFWPFAAPGGRLTLSNFSFADAHVQTVVTAAADCTPQPGAASSDFILPLNGTRVVEAMPGADVCWRRAVEAAPGEAPVPPGWTDWSRVYTSTGRTIDSRL